MENVISNLLFDKDYNLVGIVDWEWNRVVPIQFMVPPIWFNPTQLDFLLLIQENYCKQVVLLSRNSRKHRVCHRACQPNGHLWRSGNYVLFCFLPKPLIMLLWLNLGTFIMNRSPLVKT